MPADAPPPNSEIELSQAEKEAIRTFIVRWLTLPGIVASIIVFLLGYFINGAAHDEAKNSYDKAFSDLLLAAKDQASQISALAKSSSADAATIKDGKAVVDQIIEAPLDGLVAHLQQDGGFFQTIKSLNISALKDLSKQADQIKRIRISYATKTVTTLGNSTAGVTAIAVCPAETPVAIAGGFKYGTRSVNVYYSYPTAYGWLVRAGSDTTSAQPSPFTAYAVCANIELIP